MTVPSSRQLLEERDDACAVVQCILSVAKTQIAVVQFENFDTAANNVPHTAMTISLSATLSLLIQQVSNYPDSMKYLLSIAKSDF